MRVAVVAGSVVSLASFARADAPIDQYGLFDQTKQSIQDVRTGLYWQRYASTTPVLYAGAFTACSTLTLDGVTTWRVPSYKELLTIVDEVPHEEYEGGQLVLKAIDSHAFPGTSTTSAYYSSSLMPSSPGSAFAVSFHTGQALPQDVATTAYVRCVHD
jgi:hypothetical protein